MDTTDGRAGRIEFRAVAQADVPDIQRWLSDPEVAEWWRANDLSLEAMIGKYTPIIDGSDKVRGFVIVVDGDPVGYIQAYRLADHPEYQQAVDVDPEAVATDLFIGKRSHRGRGWGTEVLRQFLGRVIFGKMAARVAMIAPEAGNARAIRVYARLGFRWVKTVPVPDDDRPGEVIDEYVMLLDRDDALAVMK